MEMEERNSWRIKRMEKRITLTEIAKELGCTHALISMFEDGDYMAQDKIEKYVDYIENHEGKTKKAKKGATNKK